LLLPPLLALHLPLPLASLRPRLARSVISITIALVVPDNSSSNNAQTALEGMLDHICCARQGKPQQRLLYLTTAAVRANSSSTRKQHWR
jgi:hypothetical protein